VLIGSICSTIERLAFWAKGYARRCCVRGRAIASRARLALRKPQVMESCLRFLVSVVGVQLRGAAAEAAAEAGREAEVAVAGEPGDAELVAARAFVFVCRCWRGELASPDALRSVIFACLPALHAPAAQPGRPPVPPGARLLVVRGLTILLASLAPPPRAEPPEGDEAVAWTQRWSVAAKLLETVLGPSMAALLGALGLVSGGTEPSPALREVVAGALGALAASLGVFREETERVLQLGRGARATEVDDEEDEDDARRAAELSVPHPLASLFKQ
jgi:hypothetical protein